MDCTEVDERGIAESYVLGRLSDEERDAFEAHYFDCASCYTRLQALLDVRDALARERRPQVAPWVWAAAAAAIALASSAVWLTMGARSRPEPPSVTATAPASRPDVAEIARLAAVTPPPYATTRLRNAARRDAFSAGMGRYSAGDFAAAIPLLERAARDEPAAEDARFYLGASRLLQGDGAGARAALQTLADDTASAYAEEARFLIAKAHLRSGDAAAAIAELERTIALHGDREQDAVSLIARIRAASPGLR